MLLAVLFLVCYVQMIVKGIIRISLFEVRLWQRGVVSELAVGGELRWISQAAGTAAFYQAD